MLLNIITTLSLIVLILILSQPPKGESLGNAFNGEEIYVSKSEKFLKRSTFIIAGVIAILLIVNMVIKF